MRDVEIITVSDVVYATIRKVIERHKVKRRPLYIQHDGREVIVLGCVGFAHGHAVGDLEADGIANATTPQAERIAFTEAQSEGDFLFDA